MKFWFCLLCLVLGGTAQQRNSTALLPETMLGGPVSMAQIPPSILFADTGIMIRYVLMFSILAWDGFTLCDPQQTALNFFGGVDRLPADVCSSPDTPGELLAYSYMRVAEMEFPEPARNYAQLMLDNGYDPEDRSMDTSTAIGMGNVIGTRLAEWMGKDGWNSRGDLTRDKFNMPFEDYTGYIPVNSPDELSYPLRWQPLVDVDPKFGRFIVQEHVIPFAGYTKPLLLSHDEFVSRHAEFPYPDMNVTELSKEDKMRMDALVQDVVQASANSSPLERALAKWFDNKFFSIGVFTPTYLNTLGLDSRFFTQWVLGDAMAQHDAILLAWKEKRRIDAVRPRSIINNLYADEDFPTFVSPEVGVTSVEGKEWEPLVTTQPHSEFPSASAVLCTAFADHATEMLKEHMETHGLTEEPGIVLSLSPSFEGFDEFKFKTVKEAGSVCGMSRVWAGVHFPPAVPAGEQLAEGLGLKAYEFVKELAGGSVPARCWWCHS